MNNILYARSIFLPLSETFILNEVKNYIDHRPIITAIKKENKYTFEKYNLIYNKKYLSLIENYPFIKKKNYLLYWDYISNCERIIKDNNVSLIHSSFGVDGLFHLPLKVRTKLPFIVSFRGYDSSVFPKKYPEVYKQLFHEADAFIVCSRYMKNQILKIGCPEKKIKIIYFGIPKTEIVLDSLKRNTIVVVGRLVEKKGHYNLIKAIKGLKDIKLIIIGEGPERKKLEEFSDKSVNFIGALNHSDTLKEMSKADIVVVPSLKASNGDEEGIPIVLLEALSLGKPIVTTNHAGIPEVIKDGYNGLIVEPNDIYGMRKAIIKLIHDNKLRNELIENSKITYKEKFTIQRQMKQLEELYYSLSRERV